MRPPFPSRPRTRRSLPTGLLVADRPCHVGPIWEVRTAVLDGGELVVKRARRPNEATAALLAAEAGVLASLPAGRCVRLVGLVNPRSSHDHLLITEQVAGGTLAELVGSGPLGPREVTGVMVDLARVLSGVHSAGWMHGRIDADHVLVGPDRRVVLAGFGRARRDVQGRLGAEGRAADVAQIAALARILVGSTSGTAVSGHAGLDAVLARIEDPDPTRRPDAAHVVELLRRFAPVPAPLPRNRAGTTGRVGKHNARSAPAGGEDPPGPTPETSGTTASERVRSGEDSPSASRPDVDEPGSHLAPTTLSERRGGGPTRQGQEQGRGKGQEQRRAAGVPRPATAELDRSKVVAAVIGAAGVLMLVTGGLRLTDLPQGGADTSAPMTSPDEAADLAAAPPPCEQVGSPVPPDGAVTAQVDPDGRGCTVPVHWSAGSGELTVSTPEGVRRFHVGRPGDRLVLGDWDCDGRSTPLLVRPGVDVAFRFDAWPIDSTPVEPVQIPLPGGNDDPAPPPCR